MPPPLVWRRSSFVTVRGHTPPWTVTRNVPSSPPSGANAVGLGPTLSRSLPRNASVIVGGGGTTVKPPVLMTTWPSAFTTVTSRGPSAAAVPIVRATDSWVDETNVVELTVMSAPNDAVAPVWKFVPVTETVRLAPGALVFGDTLEIEGRIGRFTLVPAEVPSAKLAVSVNVDPVVNGVGVRSDANMKNAPPSATGKFTVPLAPFRSAPSRLAVAPSAQ